MTGGIEKRNIGERIQCDRTAPSRIHSPHCSAGSPTLIREEPILSRVYIGVIKRRPRKGRRVDQYEIRASDLLLVLVRGVHLRESEFVISVRVFWFSNYSA